MGWVTFLAAFSKTHLVTLRFEQRTVATFPVKTKMKQNLALGCPIPSRTIETKLFKNFNYN
jgi:hypothetical protein